MPPFISLIHQNKKNTIILIITTLAPVGVAYRYEITIPIKKHIIDIIAEQSVTLLKVLNILIDVSAGNIIRLEIRRAPIIRIPRTIVMAVKNAINMLYMLVLTPVACAKFSSKVTANILL